MPPFLQDLFQSSYRVINFPLFKLGKTDITLATLLTFLIFCVGVIVLERLLRRYLIRRVLSRTGMDESMQYTVSRVVGYLVLVAGFYVALLTVGIELGSLAVVAGAFGLGLGFGLQNVISNFVSGIIILFERSLKVGDFVELESGVAYGTDKELVRRAVLEAADRVLFTVKNDPKRAPQVWFVRFGNSSLDFELVVWIGPEAVKRPAAVQAAYLWEIHTALYAHQLEIPFPQNDVHFRSFFGLKDEEAKRWFEQHLRPAEPGAEADRKLPEG